MAIHTMDQIAAMNMACPECAVNGRTGTLVPMYQKPGLRCGIKGNYFNKFKKQWSICSYTYFLQPASGDTSGTTFILRPSTFPVIENPTDQQRPVYTWFGTDPAKKGGRLLIVNAGPGCAKTSTVSWSAEAAWNRLKDLNLFEFVAFNRNAKDVLYTKLPHQVTGIYTLNGLGMRMQGYKSDHVDDSKNLRIFNGLIESIHPDNRPSFDGIDELIDRMRAFCLYNDPRNEAWWTEAVSTTAERFGMLEGQRNPKETLERWIKYVPLVMEAALKINKIDLAEQWSRAVTEAMAEHGLTLPANTASREFKMNDEFVEQVAAICRVVNLPSPKGLVIDEGQDLSLGQIIFYISAAFRQTEVVVIGDDKHGKPEDDDYKAGQGIYGWRGSFGGSMAFIGKLWESLTGEKPKELPLSVTFRSAPEVVEAFRPLNKTLKSAKPKGSGFAFSAPEKTAFALWCAMPESLNGKPLTAFWVTRTNKESGKVLVNSIKARVPVAFRGGNNFEKSLDAILYNATADDDKRQDRVGFNRKTGEFPGVELIDVRRRLEVRVSEVAEQSEERAADMLEQFLVSVIDEIIADPTVLQQVQGLPHYNPTLGNVRRFLLAFADKSAARCVSNVYRIKGEEADWVFVSDAAQFNKAWGGDEDEAASCRLVAVSRAATGLIVAGALAGVVVDPITDEFIETLPQSEGAPVVTYKKEAFKRQMGKVRLTKVSEGLYKWEHYEVKKEKANGLWYIKDTKKDGATGVVGPLKSYDACKTYLEKA